MEEVPFEDRSVPKVEIDWGRSFWWWIPISRAVQPAIRMSSLLYSVLAVLALRFGLSYAQKLFDTQLSFADLLDQMGRPAPWLGRVLPMANPVIPELTLSNLAMLTFAIVWIALVSAVFGGVLARRAAVELGQRSIAPWIRSIQLVVSRLVSYVWASGMHIVAIVALLIPVVLLGWLSRLSNVTATIAGILLLAMCVPLIFSLGRLVISLVVCYPLSVCAISIEKRADSFEGFSRSNAYIFQRPVLAVLCTLLLVVFGEVGAFIVHWTVSAGWGLVERTMTATGSMSSPATATYLGAGGWLATQLVLAFRFSYFWSAAAGLYLVLRRCVDNTDLEEMDLFESELELNPPRIPSVSQPATSAETTKDAVTTEVTENSVVDSGSNGNE